jgi:hypothetical protein
MAIEYLYCLLLNVPCLILLKLLVFFDVLSGGRRCVIKIQWLFADRFINKFVLRCVTDFASRSLTCKFLLNELDLLIISS